MFPITFTSAAILSIVLTGAFLGIVWLIVFFRQKLIVSGTKGKKGVAITLSILHWYLCPAGTFILALTMPKTDESSFVVVVALILISVLHIPSAGRHLDRAFT